MPATRRTISLRPAIFHEFQSYCIRHGYTMASTVEAAVQAFMREGARVHGSPQEASKRKPALRPLDIRKPKPASAPAPREGADDAERGRPRPRKPEVVEKRPEGGNTVIF